ncbi:MAG: helix-turn-helix transcriptional regulator [Actinomycetota bacterium]|nr:helix-turn-helix transcriptional regulator [Actinomycetota bacterium]
MISRITGREKQILRLINERLTNKEIAVRLDISTHTVENHCRKIYAKLGVKDRYEAVDVAKKSGYLE